MTKIAIIQFPGSNCDRDVHKVLNELGVESDLVWYKKELTWEYDGVVLPGGFSYGDYLRAGAIAARTPIMESVKEFAENGAPVIGICNGFQMLTEIGILPGTLMINRYPKFKCMHVHLKVENNKTRFTSGLSDEVLEIPIAHAEGNYYAENDVLREIEENSQVAFRYTDKNGRATQNANPNGSKNNIAGVLNESKNVLGMMPHPERASSKLLGSQDGIEILKGLIENPP